MSTAVRTRGGGVAVVTALAGTVFIAAGAFWLSFMALADLAARSGIAPGQAWIWPLLVDGLIVVSTIAVVALDGRRGAWYPWALLICGALVSVAANALHAIVAAGFAADHDIFTPRQRAPNGFPGQTPHHYRLI